MPTTAVANLVWHINPLRLAGPLLDRELRVISRRPKHYWLRLAYVGLLAVVIFHFWHAIVQVGGGGSTVVQVSRLGETGKRVIVAIVWFQFIMAQVLAIVLLNDEIVRSKAIVALRKNVSLLVPLLVAHLLALLSSRSGIHAQPHPVFCGSVPIVLLLGTTVFVLGGGLYAGARCRTTTAAVVPVLGSYFVLLLVAGLLFGGGFGMLPRGSHGHVVGTVRNQLFVGCIGASLGLLALEESARTLRCNVF